MECLLDSGYVDSLGVCDLDKNVLEKFYEWVWVRNIKLCMIYIVYVCKWKDK